MKRHKKLFQESETYYQFFKEQLKTLTFEVNKCFISKKADLMFIFSLNVIYFKIFNKFYTMMIN